MNIPILLFSLLSFFQAPSAAPKLLELKVAGQPVPLYEFPAGAFAVFEVARPVTVELRAGFDVRWVDIRPLSAGVVPKIGSDHNTLTFQMKAPVPLTVEFNGDWKRNVVHLFANPPEKNPPAPDTPNVRYFGPGVHEAGVIELKDGETLYLAPGSWVKGVVRSFGAKNIAIRGRGILDASILARRTGDGGQPQAAPSGPAVRGPRNVIYLEKTEGAKVEGITLVNAPSWTFYLRGARGTHVDGVRLMSYSAACSTDGIDIVSSSDTLVENVFVRGNDDCIAIKNMDDIDQRNITVRNSVFWNMPCGNGVEIGFEMRSAKTEKVRFENIDIIRVERGAAISIHNGDSAVIEDVVFDNIRIEDARHKLIDFAVVYGRYGAKDRPDRSRQSDPGGAWDGVMILAPEERAARSKDRGVVRNVRVRNLHVVDGGLPFSVIAGFDREHPVENVVIEGWKFLGRPIRNVSDGKFSVEHAPGFTIR
jgi:hypothetical protein